MYLQCVENGEKLSLVQAKDQSQTLQIELFIGYAF